jgi:hypothetical protein
VDHVFIDLSVVDKRIVDLAMIRAKKNGNVVAAYQSKISSDGKKDGAPFFLVYDAIQKAIASRELDEKVLVVINNSEAKTLLRHETEIINQQEFFLGRLWIDLGQIAWPLIYSKVIGDKSLKTLAEFYQVPCELGDTAGNVACISRIYFTMMQRYKTALVAENAVSDLGGEAFKDFRNMFGI